MYSMEVCVSTVSIIVGDDALGVPIFLTHWINRDYHNDVTPKIIWHQWYNNYALFLRTGRPFLWSRNCVAPLQVWWDSLYGYRTVLSPWICFFDGRTVFAPTDLLPWGSCFSRLYSIFKLRSGYDIWYYVLGVAYTKYHNARPRPDTSTLQPVPESLIVFTKSQGLYVPASI